MTPRLPRAEAEARDVLPGCWCGPEYKDRGLIAPDCVWCNFGEDVTAAICAAREAGARAMQDAAVQVHKRHCSFDVAAITKELDPAAVVREAEEKEESRD